MVNSRSALASKNAGKPARSTPPGVVQGEVLGQPAEQLGEDDQFLGELIPRLTGEPADGAVDRPHPEPSVLAAKVFRSETCAVRSLLPVTATDRKTRDPQLAGVLYGPLGCMRLSTLC